MKVDGLEDTIKNIDIIDKEYRKNANAAVKAGSLVMLEAVKARAPVRSGLTLANIKIRPGRRGQDYVSKTVGVGKKDFTGPTFYIAFDLFGHYVGSRSLGTMRTKVPGNNFIEAAFLAEGEKAGDAIVEKWEKLNEDSTPKI